MDKQPDFGLLFLFIIILGAIVFAIAPEVRDFVREPVPEPIEYRLEPAPELLPPEEEYDEVSIPDVDPDELHCLALNIYHEGRGESEVGKLAIAHTTLNRVKIGKPRFRNNICDVVYQGKHWKTGNGKRIPLKNKCEFSWYCDGKSDKINLTDGRGNIIPLNVQSWTESNEIAFAAITGQTVDPTNGADHYYNPELVRRVPKFAKVYKLVASVDNHVFHSSGRLKINTSNTTEIPF